MEDFYTINQAALILKVHALTVRRYVKEGRLHAFRVGGSVRITSNDLQGFIEGFTPNPKLHRLRVESKKPFSPSDPIFRLKARGLSMSKVNLG